MLLWVITILFTGLGAAGIYFFFVKLKGTVFSDGAGDNEQVLEEIKKASERVIDLLSEQSKYVGKGQVQTVEKQIDELKNQLNNSKTDLAKIESALEAAQKNVEQKELVQQNIKTAKVEDQVKLEQLLTSYNDISSQSMTLEQQLAESMKNLDALMASVPMSDAQKAAVNELSQALSDAGERMRDLMMEFNTVNERLQMLNQQHDDLEGEYTRLVEKQLGE